MLKKLNKSESLNRSHKIFLKKTSDLIEKLNAQQTEQQLTIYKLNNQLKVVLSLSWVKLINLRQVGSNWWDLNQIFEKINWDDFDQVNH